MGQNIEQTDIKQRIWHLLRVITIPPVMAFLLLTLLFILRPAIFDGWPAYLLSLLFIVALPVIAFLVWRASELGLNFFILEDQFFGRHFLALGATISARSGGLESVLNGNSQAAVYYALEAGSVLLGLAARGLFFRREKGLALYSLTAILLSLFSGAAQGMARYVLAAPVVFLCLGEWGKSRVFDRAWTFASVLLFGLSAMLFSFDFWVG